MEGGWEGGSQEGREESRSMLLPILISLSHLVCEGPMPFHTVPLQHRPGSKFKGLLSTLKINNT
jgi:hypothetical protein